MVELVDTLDLKSNEHRARAGSSPAPGTFDAKSPGKFPPGFSVFSLVRFIC